MELATKNEIFCHGFHCEDCPFNGFEYGCRLTYVKDKAVFMLAAKKQQIQ